MAGASQALLADECHDLKALLTACTSPRLRRALDSELRSALDSLSGLVADLAELNRLRSEATRANTRLLLERDAVRLEALLEGSAPLLASAAADGLVGSDALSAVVSASVERKPTGNLPEFCWASPHKPVLRIPAVSASDDAEVMRLLKASEPFLLTNSGLCASAVGKWTPEYLCAHFGDAAPCIVYESDSSDFRYWDGRKNKGHYAFPDTAHTRKLDISMAEFYKKSREALKDPRAPRVYLQTSLVEGVGKPVVADFTQFKWPWAKSLSSLLGWGALTSNVVFVGMAGHTTPAHFDEQQNLLAQLCGRKRVLLWPPADWLCLYPFPIHHPCDRQSQLDLRNVDLAVHPRFAEAQPHEVILEPGDVLYLPQYWWHHVENLDDDCVSVNFWYVDNSTRDVQLPLSEKANVALRRNIERLMAEKAGLDKAHACFAEIAQGKPDSDISAETLTVVQFARSLLKHVFSDEAVIESWLVELTAGRFMT